MAKSDYAEKLTDPRWQKKRLEIFQRDSFACRICYSSTETLNVHHRYYIPKRDPWDYPDWSFVTTCASCHGLEHSSKGVKKWEEIAGSIISLDPVAEYGTETIATILEALPQEFSARVMDIMVDALSRFWLENMEGKIPMRGDSICRPDWISPDQITIP